MIWREKPLGTIPKSREDVTQGDIRTAFRQLPPGIVAQLMFLRHNNSKGTITFRDLYKQNSFCFFRPGGDEGRAKFTGMYIIGARFNRSCLPNAELSRVGSPEIVVLARKNIAAGEEIIVSYLRHFLYMTRLERHECLWFECDCKACRLGTNFQVASDMRQRLIRGLIYLTDGREVDGSSACWLITDSRLREAAENLELPVTSRFVYIHLFAFLIEEEGLMSNELLKWLGKYIPAISLFEEESNAAIARCVEAQDT